MIPQSSGADRFFKLTHYSGLVPLGQQNRVDV